MTPGFSAKGRVSWVSRNTVEYNILYNLSNLGNYSIRNSGDTAKLRDCPLAKLIAFLRVVIGLKIGELKKPRASLVRLPRPCKVSHVSHHYLTRKRLSHQFIYLHPKPRPAHQMQPLPPSDVIARRCCSQTSSAHRTWGRTLGTYLRTWGRTGDRT